MRWIAFVFALFFAFPVVAQERDDRARRLFEEAALAYSEARYESALQLFEQAFELSGRTDLLYNIGLTLERLRRDEDAVVPFEQYLETNPPAERRAEVERRLAELRAHLAGGEDPATSSSPAPWIVAAAGGVLAIAGAVLWGVGASQVADVEDSPTGTVWSEVSDDADRGRALSLAGVSLISVGVATGAVGLAWGLARSDGSEDRTAMIQWQGRF